MAALKPAVLFDLDGTLADSIPLLVEVYFEFLGAYGCRGSLEEFASLNGPSIGEFIPILKRAHGLPGTVEALSADCRARIDRAYRERVRPREGAEAVLRTLAAAGHPLWLVTSGLRATVSEFLERQGWSGWFAGVVCGDDVRRAKPAPDPYLLAMRRAGLARPQAIAVEDSPNGVRSARAAGAWVVGLASHHTPAELLAAGADASAQKLEDLLAFTTALAGEPLLVARGPIDVRWREPRREIDAAGEIAELWESQSLVQEGVLFDAPLLAMARITETGATTVVEGEYVGYRYYWAQRRGLDYERGIRPLAVSGVLIARDRGEEHVLFARRSNAVTSYPGRLELVPSGGIDETARRPEGVVDVIAKALDELGEETGFEAARVERAEAFALVLDLEDRCYDVAVRLELTGRPAELSAGFQGGSEYGAPLWVPRAELRSFIAKHRSDLVPTSYLLAELVV